MKLKDQVCSLKLAIKLKKLGVVVPSLFFFEWAGAKPSEIEFQEKPDYNPDNANAYTVAELGEMLKPRYYLTVSWDMKSEWVVCSEIDRLEEHVEHSANLADAMAKMLVYLLEKKLLTV